VTAPRVFADTSVLALAIGGEHEHRASCRALLAAATAGQVELHVSVEALQELLFHRTRRAGRDAAVADVRDSMRLCRVHSFDLTVLARTVDLVAATHLRGRDAVHASTAMLHGFTEMVTTDADFDGLPELARLAPAEAVSRVDADGH
jgi:predicted nucleic acid-binding protein